MEFEKYLVSVTHPHGGICSIVYYADTPNKKYRIYWCGSDTGKRFDRLENASQHLESLACTWEKHSGARITRQYAARDEIQQRESNAKRWCKTMILFILAVALFPIMVIFELAKKYK